MKTTVSLVFLLTSLAQAANFSGLWQASITLNELEIPFRIQLEESEGKISGSFFNGDERVESTGGTAEGNGLVLRFDHYGSRLEATLSKGVLVGRYVRGSRTSYPFQAVRAKPGTVSAEGVPSIAGEWLIPTESSKGEAAWRFLVKQSGAEVSAAILRIDGDTGALTGSWNGGRFVLSHFSGARPSLYEVSVGEDGRLTLLHNRKTKYTAVRSERAKAEGLRPPSDPTRHTAVQDSAEPLRFSAPDLNGRLVHHTDERFRGKVVLVNVTGSWCPNCHDEAPFLAELYRRYGKRGLEIVGLSFEEEEQLSDPGRLRAFVRKYGIEYPVLLAGQPSELAAKLPQAVNLNAWPTTFFIGRDGTVRGTHTGFAGVASGPAHEEQKRHFVKEIEKLLGEQEVSRR